MQEYLWCKSATGAKTFWFQGFWCSKRLFKGQFVMYRVSGVKDLQAWNFPNRTGSPSTTGIIWLSNIMHIRLSSPFFMQLLKTTKCGEVESDTASDSRVPSYKFLNRRSTPQSCHTTVPEECRPEMGVLRPGYTKLLALDTALDIAAYCSIA